MSEYISKITLAVNGQDITDFDSAEEKEYEVYKTIPLMNKTGHMKTTPRYGVSLEYVIPAGSEFDFRTVVNGTILIQRTGGSLITYSGCYILKMGAVKYDSGDNAAKRTVEFSAEQRVEG